jgi:hypothetical protein
MNERIRELADEAGLRFTQLMSNPMVPIVDGRETDLEKFAELIVKECMRMCDCADVSLLEHGCDKEASGAAGAKQFIKEWFEVEE